MVLCNHTKRQKANESSYMCRKAVYIATWFALFNFAVGTISCPSDL